MTPEEFKDEPLPDFKPIPNALQMNFSKALLKVVKNHKLKIDKLTENQTAEVFRQAILSGDLTRQVVVSGNGHGQNVVYIPFAMQENLKARIKVLEEELTRHGIPLP